MIKTGDIVTLSKPPHAMNIDKEIKDTDVHLWSVDNTEMCVLT